MVIHRRDFLSMFAAGYVGALAALEPANAFGAMLPPPSRELLTSLTLSEASAQIASGTVSSVELTTACLDRIRIYNPKLETFITVLSEQAMAQAKLLDQERRSGKLRSPLHGIPIAIKDNMDLGGARTTGGSAVLDDHVPTQSAEVVRRLVNAGAVLIGKTNMSEFAFGVSYFGSVRNPWALDRDTGGSSSGSAAAVAAELCYGALGTDTGCSVRMPAAWCGVLGFKATYGLVPLRGILPDVPTYAHCGPLARTSEDIALLLTQIAGYDRLDTTSVDHAREDYVAAMKQPVNGLHIGIARAPFFDHLDPCIAEATDEAIRVIAALVASTKEVILPSIKDRNLDTNAEMYVYHQELFRHYSDQYMLATREGVEAIRTGLNAPSGACSDEMVDYIRARDNLDLLRRTIDDTFSDIDLVVLPTMRHIPRTLDESNRLAESLAPHNPEGDMLRDCTENNVAFNAYGIPAITIPCGFTKEGLPIGLMIAGPNFSEARILALAHAYEKNTSWHKRKPPLSPDMPVPKVAVEQDPR
jgi:aspartyl-tRNA(Asn)/glutamyl-tRNA(Gln) amidotransferase subunit A